MLSRVLPCPLPAGPRNSDSHAFGQHFYLFDRLHKTGSRRDRRLRLKYDISPTAKSLPGKLFSIRFREKSGNNGPNFRRLCQARMIYQLGISKKAACRTSPPSTPYNETRGKRPDKRREFPFSYRFRRDRRVATPLFGERYGTMKTNRPDTPSFGPNKSPFFQPVVP